MNEKQRVHAALEGRPVDRMPVTALYNQLYHRDHFAELTGRPQWQLQQWRHATPEEHLETYAKMVAAAPFETLQPQPAPSREARENTRFFEKDGTIFRRFKDDLQPIARRTGSGHALDYQASEIQTVFDESDAEKNIRIVPADRQRETGIDDYLDAAVRRFGGDHFILSGGVIGAMYSCARYVGMTRLFELLIEQPGLIDCLCKRILQQNIETIRRLAAAGGDAIYIDDATATSDMISVAHYERFSLPYVREMVREIHGLGHKAILIYFGGVADRLEQIASAGADGLSVETSMKGYVNDIGAVAQAVGGRVSLFGNIDPVGTLQRACDDALAAEIERQAAAGRKARGFIISPGSPITPATPLRRVRRFIELARRSGRQCDQA